MAITDKLTGMADVTAPSTAGHAAPHPRLPRLHELDGLRGVLALLVVAYHLAGPLPQLRALLAYWTPPLAEGWYAVDVFFMMSGFVMLLVYERVFASGVSVGKLIGFFQARVARLYPVHLAVMLVLLVGVTPYILRAPWMGAPDGRYSWHAALASLFMLHSPWIDHRTWNYPSWSISAEWHAYVLFPFLVPLMLKARRIVSAGLVAVAVLATCLLYQQHLTPDQYPSNGMVVLARTLPLFIAGMALQRLWALKVVQPQPLGLVALAGTLLLLSSPVWASYAVLLVPLVIMATLRPGVVRQGACSAPLQWLGKISYSLYMTHALLDIFYLLALNKLAYRMGGEALQSSVAFQLVAWLTAMLLALAGGWLTWRYVEVPGRSWSMRKVFGQRPSIR